MTTRTWSRAKINYTDEQVQVARTILANGGRIADIAKALTIPRHRAVAIVNSDSELSSMLSDSKGIKAEEEQRINEMWKSGMTCDEIANRLHIDYNRVYYITNRKVS